MLTALIAQEDEEAARGKLFESKADNDKVKQARKNRNAAYNIGKDLAGALLDGIEAATSPAFATRIS